eukprot:461926-Lingulodinium_polyedra.AAC.1
MQSTGEDGLKVSFYHKVLLGSGANAIIPMVGERGVWAEQGNCGQHEDRRELNPWGNDDRARG